MIAVRIYITVNIEKENEFRNAIEALCTKIEQEKGCISCSFYQNTQSPQKFLLVEKWKSMQSVKEHIASKNMAILAGAGVIFSHEIRVSLDRSETVQELNREYIARLSAIDDDS